MVEKFFCLRPNDGVKVRIETIRMMSAAGAADKIAEAESLEAAAAKYISAKNIAAVDYRIRSPEEVSFFYEFNSGKGSKVRVLVIFTPL